MPNRVNQLLFDEYKAAFRDVTNFVAVGYAGMTVTHTNALRIRLDKSEMKLLFVKNRMAHLALQDLGRPDIRAICNGQTALVYGEDPVGVARLLIDFQKEHKELAIHGACVEDTVLDENRTRDLSKSPSKEELKGIISGQALSPGAAISGALLGAARLLASQVKKHAENIEEKESA